MQLIEIKRLSDNMDEVVLGEFFIEPDSVIDDNGTVNIDDDTDFYQGTVQGGIIVMVACPVYRQNPPAAEIDGELPAAPAGSHLVAITLQNLRNQYAAMLNSILATKALERERFGIDDIRVDALTFPVDGRGMRANTNEYWYMQVLARKTETGETMIRMQRGDNALSNLDDPYAGYVFGEAVTPHGCAAVILSRRNRHSGSYHMHDSELQGNLDVQPHFETHYNEVINSSGMWQNPPSSVQVLEINAREVTTTDWVVIGELGVKYSYQQSSQSYYTITPLYPNLLLTVIIPY